MCWHIKLYPKSECLNTSNNIQVLYLDWKAKYDFSMASNEKIYEEIDYNI